MTAESCIVLPVRLQPPPPRRAAALPDMLPTTMPGDPAPGRRVFVHHRAPAWQARGQHGGTPGTIRAMQANDRTAPAEATDDGWCGRRTGPGPASKWNTPMDPRTGALQAKVAQAMADHVDDDWERIFINYEMKRSGEGRLVDYMLFYIKSTPDGDFELVSLPSASDAINDAFIALADTMARDGERWGSCDFLVDADGRYRFSFSYDPPKRIEGVLDHSSYGRFDEYLDQYRAERAAGAAG